MQPITKLWKYNRITGLWDFQRVCLTENAAQWLKVFRADAPEEFFTVATRRPTRAPVR